MAKKDNNNEEKESSITDDLLIREVDDELRAERLQNWWNKFGSLIIVACITIILATIAYQLTTSFKNSSAESETAILLEAQNLADKGQINTALEKLKTLAKENSGGGNIAKLRVAELSKEKGSYKDVAAQKDYPAISDIALIESNNFADAPKDSPFYLISAEQKVVSMLKSGKNEEAKTLILSLLEMKAVPDNQRKRLNELLQGVN